MADITLTLLTGNDREQFILDNQRAFKYGAMEEFGERDSHFEEDGEIISRKTIENSIDHGVAYRIRENGRIFGGLVLQIDEKTHHNHLDLLFVSPNAHSKGIGTAAWKCVEVVCQLSNQRRRPDSYVKLEVDAEDYYKIKDEDK